MEERIIAIQNLSITPITIEGVLLNQNAIMYTSIGFWQTADWRPLTTSTTLKVFLSTGIGYDLTTNPNEYANAFARTANFVSENYLMLLELEKIQGQVITTNATLTTITEFSLPNGLTDFEILVKGNEVGTTNYYRGIFFPSVVGVTNALTLSPSFTTGGITSRVGFGGGVGANGIVTGNILRIQVTGQTGRTILWKVKIIRKN